MNSPKHHLTICYGTVSSDSACCDLTRGNTHALLQEAVSRGGAFLDILPAPPPLCLNDAHATMYIYQRNIPSLMCERTCLRAKLVTFPQQIT